MGSFSDAACSVAPAPATVRRPTARRRRARPACIEPGPDPDAGRRRRSTGAAGEGCGARPQRHGTRIGPAFGRGLARRERVLRVGAPASRRGRGMRTFHRARSPHHPTGRRARPGRRDRAKVNDHRGAREDTEVEAQRKRAGPRRPGPTAPPPGPSLPPLPPPPPPPAASEPCPPAGPAGKCGTAGAGPGEASGPAEPWGPADVGRWSAGSTAAAAGAPAAAVSGGGVRSGGGAADQAV